MPSRKRRKKAAAAAPPIRTSISPQIHQPVGTSDYKHFLDSYLPYPGVLSQKEINTWKDSNDPVVVPDPIKTNIINEIAKKFNNTNTSGIPNFSYNQKGPGSSTLYSVDVNGDPRLDMLPNVYKKYGPNPLTIAHELMHANDHQSSLANDHLTPKMWERLRTLATEGGAAGNAMNSFNDFTDSIKQIQERLDPTSFTDPMYTIDQPYMEGEIKKAGGAPAVGGDAQYVTPPTGGIQGNPPDWMHLFDKIRDVATHNPNPPHGLQNPYFFLNRVSEFPTFMMENLTRSWDTANPKLDNQGNVVQNALTRPQARTMYHMLGDIGDSYTAQEAPVMNQHLHNRRNSIFGAYNPVEAAAEAAAAAANTPIPPRTGGWSHGGRVTGKNLFSRFKKPKRKAS